MTMKSLKMATWNQSDSRILVFTARYCFMYLCITLVQHVDIIHACDVNILYFIYVYNYRVTEIIWDKKNVLWWVWSLNAD